MGKQMPAVQQPKPNVWGAESARLLAAEKMKLGCLEKPTWQAADGAAARWKEPSPEKPDPAPAKKEPSPKKADPVPAKKEAFKKKADPAPAKKENSPKGADLAPAEKEGPSQKGMLRLHGRPAIDLNAECLAAWGDEQFKCNCCNVQIFGRENVQSHVLNKRHQKAKDQKKCVDGIAVKRHHFCWEDVQLEEEESKDKLPIQENETPSAHESLKRSLQCIAIEEESDQKASKSKDNIANPGEADEAKPRPGHNKAVQKLPMQYKDALLNGLRCH